MANRKLEDYGKPGVFLQDGDYVSLPKGGSFYYNACQGNCKLCVLDSVSYVARQNVDELKKFFKETAQKLMFFVTLTDKIAVENLQKNFEEVYIQQVPVGYSNGFQYHCCFFTNYEKYESRDDYMGRVKKFKKNPVVVEEAIPAT